MAPVHDRAAALAVGPHVVELGCCFGFLSLRLAAEGHQVTAVDLVPGTARLLGSVSPALGTPVATLAGDALAVPLQDASRRHRLRRAPARTPAPRPRRHRAGRDAAGRPPPGRGRRPLRGRARPAWGHVRTFDRDDLHALGAATGLPFTVDGAPRRLAGDRHPPVSYRSRARPPSSADEHRAARRECRGTQHRRVEAAQQRGRGGGGGGEQRRERDAERRAQVAAGVVPVGEHPVPVLRHEHQVRVQRERAVSPGARPLLSARCNRTVLVCSSGTTTACTRPRVSAGVGAGVRVRAGGVQRRGRRPPGGPRGRGAVPDGRGAVEGAHRGEADPGAGMARRGVGGGAAAGPGGSEHRVPELLRLGEGQRKGRRLGAPRFRSKRRPGRRSGSPRPPGSGCTPTGGCGCRRSATWRCAGRARCRPSRRG